MFVLTRSHSAKRIPSPVSSSSQPVFIVWFRQDLRLRDNPALDAAVHAAREADGRALPLFILDDESPGRWKIGGASRWWLHHSLKALEADLGKRDARLRLLGGAADRIFEQLVGEITPAGVFWNRMYQPWAIERDTQIKKMLMGKGIPAESFNGALLVEPWTIKTGSDGPYKVYTPFMKAVRARGIETELKPAPRDIPGPTPDLRGAVDLDALDLLPRIDWAGGLRARWEPGELGANRRARDFVDERLKGYGKGRDLPAVEQTSRLSPHLHWGEISPRLVWRMAEEHADAAGDDAASFQNELIWREFSYHLLYHFPQMPDAPLDQRYRDFPWQEDKDVLEAWQAGRTGYPIVDAGMRELWETGVMHNRVRMITASLLVKHLLQPWQAGEAWFWDTLVDADMANNSASWQWVAGCGADAAPYFRIFNPTRQAERFDPDGDYVRRWVPELAALPNRNLNEPWAAPDEVLEKAGVRLGETYPRPIVDHKQGRERALKAFESIKTNQSETAPRRRQQGTTS